MPECKHHEFISKVSVFRLTENEHPNAEPSGFSAEVLIKCKECGREFEFIGVPGGMSAEYPTVSMDNKELRIPIKPSEG